MSDIALPLRGVPQPPLARRLSSDERLARLVARGNSGAFALLYERHHQAIYRYCRSIVREEEDAHDALQNTMMRAFAALRSQERDLAVRAWLFRIAHNESISLLGRRRTLDRAVEDEDAAANLDVEQVVAQRDRLATLVADLQTLAERQRGALIMRELSGLSIDEIAAALATSPGAAKQALFEARSSLQEMTEGRAMDCELVRRSISERDGRVLRGRKLRAHLRSCAGCREFSEAIATRSSDLRALAPPLPAGAAVAMVARLLAGGKGGGGASVAASTSGTALGGHLAGSLAVKAAAGTAVMLAAAAGTAHLVRTSRHRHHPSGAHLAVRHNGFGPAGVRPAAASNHVSLLVAPMPKTVTGTHLSTMDNVSASNGQPSAPAAHSQAQAGRTAAGQSQRGNHPPSAATNSGKSRAGANGHRAAANSHRTGPQPAAHSHVGGRSAPASHTSSPAPSAKKVVPHRSPAAPLTGTAEGSIEQTQSVQTVEGTTTTQTTVRRRR